LLTCQPETACFNFYLVARDTVSNCIFRGPGWNDGRWFWRVMVVKLRSHARFDSDVINTTAITVPYCMARASESVSARHGLVTVTTDSDSEVVVAPTMEGFNRDRSAALGCVHDILLRCNKCQRITAQRRFQLKRESKLKFTALPWALWDGGNSGPTRMHFATVVVDLNCA
jgi:hypothetical protein